ncbi:MAG: 2-amino-4-hydroxy-6-hydroxymethyldihydropteridine diphosphokinase [Kiritimatiellae bacterium]|nr:2-amino-4-hydroxy-6-hydroxymethyldihydropteridine diphosphokinase [Kiritimatiellia bacterium]
MSATPDMAQAVVSLGTNIEPRSQRLADALAAIAAMPRTRLVKASSVRETEPVGVPEEFRGQRFLNQIAVCETSLEAHDFLHRLQAIEAAQGRVRGPVRNVPRTIDLDLIAFGDMVLNEPELTLPHPRARQRAFVLEPLAEALPGFRWPDMV